MKAKDVFSARLETKNGYYNKVIYIIIHETMPVKKTSETKKPVTKRATTAKRATSRKTTTTAKTAAAKQVEANTRHIEENAQVIKNNSSMIHLLYWAIIFLLLIIAGLAFYVGQMVSKSEVPGWVVSSTTAEEIVVTVIDDSRCSDCETAAVLSQLQTLPYLSSATFVQQDFSEAWISDYLQDNNITALPAIIFSDNSLNDGGQIVPYLTVLPDGQYSLALGAKFNPFASRSDKGFLILEDLSFFETMKAESPIDGNIDAKVTYIEYSDLECPFCAKLHNDGTPKALQEKYGDDMNIIFQHFPLDFHANALVAAQGLECANEQGVNMYELIDASFDTYSNNNFSVDGFYDLAVELWANKDILIECVDSEKYKDKVLAQQTTGQNVFGITGTPGNAIINNETGEYEVISGAYPAASFESIIDKMLAE